MSGAPDTLDPTKPIERDLYCLTCGYNLRGLTGDPVRCPECGNLNPVGDVEIPAPLINKQLQRMEPGTCVGALLLAVPTQFGWWWMVWEGSFMGRSNNTPDLCVTVAAWSAAAAWVASCHRFRKSCLGKTGWLLALLAYHFWGLLMMATLGGAVAGVVVFARVLSQRWTTAGIEPVVFLAALLPIALMAVLLLRWQYSAARRAITDLQREVAVTIARDAIRRRMARKR